MVSSLTSTLFSMNTRRVWLPPRGPGVLRAVAALRAVINGGLWSGLRSLLRQVTRPAHLWSHGHVSRDWTYYQDLLVRGFLGNPALVEMFRGPEGKRVLPLTKAWMGFPHSPRKWERPRRVYLDARKAEAEKLLRAERGRALRALASAGTQALPAVVVGGALGLAVVVAAAVVGEHPLLVCVARAGSA